MSKENIKDHWNLIAPEYQKVRDLSFNDIEYALGHALESELNLLGDVAEKKVIELGCGAAENSITLAKKGAICTGVDLSVEQLNLAKNSTKENNVSVDLIEGDLENLVKINDNTFDIALSIFALDWMQDLNAAFREAYRVLKKNGIFVFSMQHPIFNLLGAEDCNPKELKITENYFEKEVTFVEATEIDLRVHAAKFSDIVNGLISVGFNIETILEPKPPREDTYPCALLIPSTIICKVLKA